MKALIQDKVRNKPQSLPRQTNRTAQESTEPDQEFYRVPSFVTMRKKSEDEMASDKHQENISPVHQGKKRSILTEIKQAIESGEMLSETTIDLLKQLIVKSQ